MDHMYDVDAPLYFWMNKAWKVLEQLGEKYNMDIKLYLYRFNSLIFRGYLRTQAINVRLVKNIASAHIMLVQYRLDK